MKKYFFLAVTVFISATQLNAQSFTKGSGVLSAGIGLGSALGSFSYGSQTPAISVQYEKGLWETSGPGTISVGGYLGLKTYKYSGGYGSYKYTQKWSYRVIGIRSAYHYNGIDNEKLDVYGGVMLSYNLLNYKYSDNDSYADYQYAGSYGNAAGFTAYVGGRYYIGKNFGLFAELGYGVSYLNMGAALKF